MTFVKGWAAKEKGGPLSLESFDFGPLGKEEVEIKVEHCGLCHSDLSVINNDWSNSIYPFFPGHEVIGVIQALGENTKGLKVGQRVGVGWTVGGCSHCR